MLSFPGNKLLLFLCQRTQKACIALLHEVHQQIPGGQIVSYTDPMHLVHIIALCYKRILLAIPGTICGGSFSVRIGSCCLLNPSMANILSNRRKRKASHSSLKSITTPFLPVMRIGCFQHPSARNTFFPAAAGL